MTFGLNQVLKKSSFQNCGRYCLVQKVAFRLLMKIYWNYAKIVLL